LRDLAEDEEAFFFVVAEAFFFGLELDAVFLEVEEDEVCAAHTVLLKENAARRTAITKNRGIELLLVYQRKFVPKMDRSLSPRIRTSSCVK
jgi:hypothetical protein